jgi:phytoene dehydrogenase-like protein
MNNMTTCDVILIGAGHNGLTAAAYLARAGQKVLALERREVVGGAVVTEEFAPGFKVDTVFHCGELRPDIVRDLDLTQHGLEIIGRNAPLFAPQPEGGGLLLSPGQVQTVEAIARFSKADARQWPAFAALLSKVAGFLNEAYATTFPRVPKVDTSEAPVLAQLGLKLRGLGKRDMLEALRVLPMSLMELLDEWFESDALKGAVGAQGVHGLTQGPFSAGTAFLLVHHWANHNGLFKATAKGGLGAITQALASAAKAFGAEIRTGAEAARVNVQDGKAVGVTLTSGESISARLVVSNADPRRTFLGLVGPLELDPHFVWGVQNIKLRGAVAKVHLALDGLPRFKGVDGDAHLRGTIVISPSLPYLERAYDAAKYGEISPQPYLEITVPSLADPSLAPAGKHVLSVHAQFAPYHLKNGTWEAKREALGDWVIGTLSEYAPNLRSLILQSQILTPLDLENRFGLTEGSLHHGEMMLDQILFMRPVPGWAQYRTPIEGLYLCGSGAHPGGGVTGAPGRNAARQILKDLTR